MQPSHDRSSHSTNLAVSYSLHGQAIGHERDVTHGSQMSLVSESVLTGSPLSGRAAMLGLLDALAAPNASTVVPAPGAGEGYWAGAPSAAVVDGLVWLAYRLRRVLPAVPPRRGRTGRSADTSAPRPRSPHAGTGIQPAPRMSSDLTRSRVTVCSAHSLPPNATVPAKPIDAEPLSPDGRMCSDIGTIALTTQAFPDGSFETFGTPA
jgi:hypothetical protein